MKHLLVLALLPVFGCGLKFGEKVKATDVVEFKSGSCLSDSNKITKSFFKGEAEQPKIGQAVDCYADVIETFRDNVRGESSDSYTPAEIQIFLKNNFLKDAEFDLTPELVAELMKVKVAISGGTRFKVTHTELTILSESLRDVKADIVAFHPLMPLVFGLESIDTHTVLTENRRLQVDFSKQGRAFTDQLVKLSKLFKFSHLNYRIDELYNLVIQILKSNRTETESIEKFEALKPLVVKAAEVFVDDRQILDERSWPRLLSAVGDGYMAYRRYDLLVKGDETKNTGLDELTIEKIILQVRPTLELLVAGKTNSHVTGAEIYELLAAVKVVFTEKFMDKPDINKWIQKVLDLKSFNQLMNVLWSNVLNTPVQRLLEGKWTNEFDTIALNKLAVELASLFRSQANVYRMFYQFQLQGKSATRQEIKSYLSALKTNEQDLFESEDAAFAEEYLKMLSAPAMMTFNEKNYLKIFDESNSSSDSVYALSDVEKSNYARAGARLMINSFSRDLNAATFITAVGKQDTLDGWEMVRPIVIELEMVQPDNLTFISSRFREADLFISSSNGDDQGQFAEVHDIILHIYSGKLRSDTLRVDIVNRCMPETDPESYKAKDAIDESCLIKHYQSATNGFQSLPKYVEMLSKNPQEMPAHSLSILKAAGHEQNLEMLVKFEDIDLYPHVVQYIEMLYYKFDENRDGILDSHEAKLAFPTFRKTIADVLENLGFGSVISDPARQEGVFVYLLTKGRGPEKKATKEEQKAEMEEFWGIVNKPENRNNKTDRLMMGKLFNFFADTLNKPVKPVK